MSAADPTTPRFDSATWTPLGAWQWQHSQSGASDDAKCLVVKLGAEVADLSEAMRLTLRDGTTRIIDRLARCIADGAVDGSLPALEPLATARTLYQL